MIVAATGHRPDKLGGYEQHAERRLRAYARSVLEALEPLAVIQGCALGWDTAVALAAFDLGLPVVSAIPFEGQESRWRDGAQRIYRDILRRSCQVVVVSPYGYSRQAMQERNEYMVNECGLLLACWNGTAGGTANCLRYANAVRRPWFNCYHGGLSL